jgi:hypothetical protein
MFSKEVVLYKVYKSWERVLCAGWYCRGKRGGYFLKRICFIQATDAVPNRLDQIKIRGEDSRAA